MFKQNAGRRTTLRMAITHMFSHVLILSLILLLFIHQLKKEKLFSLMLLLSLLLFLKVRRVINSARAYLERHDFEIT